MTTEELKKLNNDLWSAATKMRSDSDLKLNEFATPILGLIFLKFADNRYSLVEKDIELDLTEQANSRRQRPIHEIAIEKCGFYLPRISRYDYLLNLPEQEDIAKAIKEAMAEIENYKPELKDVLPQNEYFDLSRTDPNLPKTLLKTFSDIPKNASGDVFGKIYEYFLGKFAMSEGQGGGEFYTPTSVVKYMVEIIEPYKGTIFDPACGSGGMFVQSSNFIDRRKEELHTTDEKDLFVYGAEKTSETVKLAKMNIVVNGLRGSIMQANAYYEDAHESFGRFDYVMANPPFNVKDVNYDRIKDDKRFNTYGIAQNKTKGKKKEDDVNLVPNGNYLWINLFATALKPDGKAALVMPNSASDARNSEKDIRERLIKKGLISQMVSLSSNLFSTVTLPASLWFFDKSKEIIDFDAEKDNIAILFVDARNVYRQIDRAQREFTQEQVLNLAVITRLHQKQEQRYIELVDIYIKNVNDLILPIKESYNDYVSNFNSFNFAFKKWFSVAKFDKIQEKLIETENIKTMFDSLEISIDNLFIEVFEKAKNEISSYIKNKNLTNSKQFALGQVLTNFEHEKKQVKKELERKYRTLEKLFKIADKEIKNKDDKQWKAIPTFKDVRSKLDVFIEHTNDQINREPKYTQDTDGKSGMYFIKQIQWLQERFPEGVYEDVIGLCKVAKLDEIEEQDYSLNSGRYVGVVIEEDGMTEEEFVEEMKKLNYELQEANLTSKSILETINSNLNKLSESYEV